MICCKAAYITFLIFGFMTNSIVTSMLLLGGTAEALTGVPAQLAAFLIPWGVILYVSFNWNQFLCSGARHLETSQSSILSSVFSF